MARPAFTYRGARKRLARRLHFIWREVPVVPMAPSTLTACADGPLRFNNDPRQRQIGR
jgi:hypothetical protein